MSIETPKGETVTVGELIELLQKHHPAKPIFIRHAELEADVDAELGTVNVKWAYTQDYVLDPEDVEPTQDAVYLLFGHDLDEEESDGEEEAGD